MRRSRNGMSVATDRSDCPGQAGPSLRNVLWEPDSSVSRLVMRRRQVADRSLALGVARIGAVDGIGGCGFVVHFLRSCPQWTCLEPQRARRGGRINPSLPPPCGFVAAAVNLTMVTAAQGDGELIANLAPQCRVLREPKVMAVGRPAAAYQTSLRGNVFDVIPVTNPARLRERQNALVDGSRPRPRCCDRISPAQCQGPLGLR